MTSKGIGGMKQLIGPHTLVQDGDVFIFTMNNGENTFNSTSLAQYNEVLDIVERHSSPHAALVVTGKDKFWCTGLDLPTLRPLPDSEFIAVVNKFQQFLARFITLPCATIAAINGHCFGGGAMWSLCFDYKIMRNDRGLWCIPAVDIGFNLTKGMISLFSSTLQPYSLLRDAVLTGKRFLPSEAASLRILDEEVSQAQVLPTAIAKANELAKKDKGSVGLLKRGLHAPTVSLLREGIPGGKSGILSKL